MSTTHRLKVNRYIVSHKTVAYHAVQKRDMMGYACPPDFFGAELHDNDTEHRPRCTGCHDGQYLETS